MSTESYLAANPLHGNPLRTRGDVEEAVRDLFAPLVPFFSEGRGRVRLGATGAHFPPAAAELEGFARPLWGLAPLLAGGGAFDHLGLFQRGLATGADPDHPDFWGVPVDTNQRIVESAALGFSLALLPEQLWHALDDTAQQNLGHWLDGVLDLKTAENNWHFFPVLVALGLDRVGWPVDWDRLTHHLDAIDSYYLQDGWYRDGKVRRLEHYIPFAIHFYGLIYAALRPGDSDRATAYRERAATFAHDYKAWFGADGSALPFGRSLTYRFAHAGFWAALAFADVDALPWGEVKGLLLANLRWWSRRPVADRDGVLSVGYAYPNYLMAEEYNSPGSPYWAFKPFAALACADDHPLWQAEEVPPTPPVRPIAQPIPGMVFAGDQHATVALSTGQESLRLRHGSAKYAKFAYSTRHGFCTESHDACFANGAFDSMLTFSDDGRHFRFRETNDDARIGDDYLYSRWSPMSGVSVETWLIAKPPFHLRVHRIASDRELQTNEGGFAIDRDEDGVVKTEAADGIALVQRTDEISAIRDLSTPPREGWVQPALPNSSLMYPRTAVPQLRATIAAGTTTFACAVLAAADGAAWDNPPDLPDDAALDTMRDGGQPVIGWAAPQLDNLRR